MGRQGHPMGALVPLLACGGFGLGRRASVLWRHATLLGPSGREPIGSSNRFAPPESGENSRMNGERGLGVR